MNSSTALPSFTWSLKAGEDPAFSLLAESPAKEESRFRGKTEGNVDEDSGISTSGVDAFPELRPDFFDFSIAISATFSCCLSFFFRALSLTLSFFFFSFSSSCC
jgi:hypothetical protein